MAKEEKDRELAELLEGVPTIRSYYIDRDGHTRDDGANMPDDDETPENNADDYDE